MADEEPANTGGAEDPPRLHNEDIQKIAEVIVDLMKSKNPVMAGDGTTNPASTATEVDRGRLKLWQIKDSARPGFLSMPETLATVSSPS